MLLFVGRLAAGLLIAALACLALAYALQDRLIFPAPQTRYAPLEGFEAVDLPTDDALNLTAHWLPPQEGKPSLVWFHGNAGTLRGAAAETELLANRGYGVLLVGYRGYGGNPGKPSEQGFYRDGRAALAFVESRTPPDSKIIIAGNSIGSGTASQMALEYKPSALILIAPFTSLTKVAQQALPFLPMGVLLKSRFDNAAKLAQLDLPVLILHGTGDKVVPFAQGKALATAARTGSFIAFDGVGHDLSFQLSAQMAQANWLEERGL